MHTTRKLWIGRAGTWRQELRGLPPEQQAAYRERLARTLRENTWNPVSRTITGARSPPSRAATFNGALLVYVSMFSIARAHHPPASCSHW